MPRVSVPSLSTLATDSLRDGMLNEGYAAWLADRQLQGATEPEVVDTLRTIARDEANHAQLSFEIVAWCVSVGGRDVADALVAAVGELPLMREAASATEPELMRHGLASVDPEGIAADDLQRRIVDRVNALLADESVAMSLRF